MNDVVSSAKADFLQAKQGLLHALANTPDERVNWSPAPTARTPIHLVVHAAEAIGAIHAALDGTPFPYRTTEAADRFFREVEAGVATREEALALFEAKAEAYVAWLEALDPARLDTSATMPFGGAVPMAFALTIPALHTRYHVAQLDYLQTAYGDRDWHV